MALDNQLTTDDWHMTVDWEATYDNNSWFMTTRVMSYDFDLWRTTNGECFMVNN